jgi:hypothetical protein
MYWLTFSATWIDTMYNMSCGLNVKRNMNSFSVLLSKQRTFIVSVWWVSRKHDCRWVLDSRRIIPQYGQLKCVRRPLPMASNAPWVAGDFSEKIPGRQTFRSPSWTLCLLRNAALDTRTIERKVSNLAWFVLTMKRWEQTHALWVLFLLYIICRCR